LSSSITGSAVIYGGGGGGAGSRNGNINGQVGSDGGGLGGNYAGTGTLVGGAASNANRGQGGGGGSDSNSGGSGSSGVVILRYLTADAVRKVITGGTITTSGLYTVHTFTSSGSLVIA
jgi:hypothetical protein